MKKDLEKQGDSNFAEGCISITSILKNNSRPVFEIYVLPEVKKDDHNILRLFKLAKKNHIPIVPQSQEFFDRVAIGHTHGGVIARVGDRNLVSCREVFEKGNGFVFMLCGIEDPFNFGCSIRSFYAAGAGGMILSPRNWLSAAGVTMRSSAGCSEAVLCAVAEDMEETLKTAKECGYQIVCASEKGTETLFEAPLKKPIFFIVGGEKRGISRNILEACDYKVKIPYGIHFQGSLTASAAAAVCAFEILRKNSERVNEV